MRKISKTGILDKKSTIIEPSVKLSDDVLVFPGAIIRGASVIESGAVIYPGSVIIDSKIKKETIIKSSFIEKSEIGANNEIGPYANVRAGTITASNVKIGSFCETKKAVIGAKTKISHLSYVGDAIIGERTNVGCGVVFANFNGKIKSQTKVGDHCFVGSNVNLIAPLEIADNAYICAGTTVTEDVPAEAFVIGRSRAQVKECRAKVYWEGD